ncbi:restriction endonuclease subunit S, partial [Escherichia marmotae]|nr:restriction endonuclease subunit S [Escherichia marmotae]
MGSNEWVSITLGELVDTYGGSVQTGPFGSQLHAADYVSVGIPSVMPKNIRIEEIDITDIARISTTDAERLKKYRLVEGDIIYSRRGDVEKCALVTKNEAGWMCGTGCLRIRIQKNSAITPEFLHACLSTPVTREWISRHAIGATMPNLNTSILREIPLIIPPSEPMNFIGKRWMDLNKKLLLNRKINQTLEQMSQTLFKSWFVDFDPVIDNALDAGNPIPEALQSRAELRQKVRNSADFKPLPAEIRSLFPSEFEETELGWVPKGWESETFDSFCDLIQSGGTPSRKETSFWDGGTIKWLSSGEVKGKIVLDTKEKITDIGLLNSSAKLWEKYTTVVAMYGATAGEVCIIGDNMTANQACCGVYSKKFPFFVYNFICNKANELASKATGSAQQNLNKSII